MDTPRKVPESEEKLLDWCKRRLSEMEQVKEPVLSIWELIGEHIVPRYQHLDWDDSPYEEYGKSVFDGTGLSAARIQAVGMQGYTVSPSMTWFSLGFPIPRVEDVPANKAYFEDSARYLYAAYRRSNFYATMTNVFMQAGVLGTTVLFQEFDEIEGKLNFLVLHPKEYYISENRYRKVDTIFRVFELPAREAVQKWPEDRLSEVIRHAAKENPDRKFKFVHAVYPNSDRQYGKLDAKNKRFKSIYWEYDNSDRILRESGYDENPYMVWRWHLVDDGPYGMSPGWDALWDVKALNMMAKDMMYGVQKLVNPPMAVPYEARGIADFRPGGFTYLKDMSRPPVQVQQRVDLQWAREREADLREIVKQHFNVDFFLMLAQREGQMTATEIRERQTEKSVMLGPAIGNLQGEVLGPTIERTWRILAEHGEVPPVPETLAPYVGMDMRVEYRSPLSQAQRRVMETQGLQVFMEKMAPLTELWPEWRDIVNIDEYGRSVAEGEGVKSTIINTPDEVAGIRQQRAEQQAAMQQAQMQNLAADTAKNLSKDIEPNSPLAQMQEEAGG